MRADTGRVNAEPHVVYRVTWFAPDRPDRPVEGGTVYIRPPADDSAAEVTASTVDQTSA